jgi:hypothetical protein
LAIVPSTTFPFAFSAVTVACGFELLTVAVRTCVELDHVGLVSAFRASLGATVRLVVAETAPKGANAPWYIAVRVMAVVAATPFP